MGVGARHELKGVSARTRRTQARLARPLVKINDPGFILLATSRRDLDVDQQFQPLRPPQPAVTALKTRANRDGPRARCSRPPRAPKAYLLVRRTPPALTHLQRACAYSSSWLDHRAKTSPFQGSGSPEIVLEDLPKHCMRWKQYAWRPNRKRFPGHTFGSEAVVSPTLPTHLQTAKVSRHG